jgi:hypothetical protein
MTRQEFITLVVEPRLDHCREVLEAKGGEYARNNDSAYNFKRAAAIRGVNVFTALDGMFNKHLVSMLDIMDDAKNGIMPSDALLNAKITDVINYLLLFEALVFEIDPANASTDAPDAPGSDERQ